jgi:hypothetical protein
VIELKRKSPLGGTPWHAQLLIQTIDAFRAKTSNASAKAPISPGAEGNLRTPANLPIAVLPGVIAELGRVFELLLRNSRAESPIVITVRRNIGRREQAPSDLS